MFPSRCGHELFDAVFDGDVTRMQQALAVLGAPPPPASELLPDYPLDCYNNDGMTPLAVASSSGHLQVLRASRAALTVSRCSRG